ncbi:MAG: hypothetical protein K0Q72_3045, partial [Armatimonadetes bacterium]|nr:hypothetical protein [Armatimonadota bacterium]
MVRSFFIFCGAALMLGGGAALAGRVGDQSAFGPL